MAEKRPNRTLGSGHDEFWRFCDEGELRIQRCRSCGHLSWPPVEAACEKCGHTELEWQRLSGQGNVISWCTFERSYYGETFPIPWDTILVELDEGPLFVSNPKGFDRDEIVPHMRVTVAFVECEDAAGVFRLPVFERA